MMGKNCANCRYLERSVHTEPCLSCDGAFGGTANKWEPIDNRPGAVNFLDEAPDFTKSVIAPQPAPNPNDMPASWHLVMRDMLERDRFGREKYGTPLQPGNGRDALVDAYQEALDLAVYLRTAIFERDGK